VFKGIKEKEGICQEKNRDKDEKQQVVNTVILLYDILYLSGKGKQY
jgi:hypothetical protein